MPDWTILARQGLPPPPAPSRQVRRRRNEVRELEHLATVRRQAVEVLERAARRLRARRREQPHAAKLARVMGDVPERDRGLDPRRELRRTECATGPELLDYPQTRRMRETSERLRDPPDGGARLPRRRMMPPQGGQLARPRRYGAPVLV